jgi:hypothetical protein
MRRVQPSILFRIESIVKDIKLWLNARSDFFSTICGESFSRREVIAAHLTVAAYILIIVLCNHIINTLW